MIDILKAVAGLIVALALSIASAAAASYPVRPVRFIVAGSPGGSDDVHARIIGPKLTEVLGQQFVVDPRPGANGRIAQTALINAAPDGYTILLAGRSLTTAPSLNVHAFDPVRAFAPVAQIATYQLVLLVRPTLPTKTVSEFIDLARTRPEKITYADPGLMPQTAAMIFRAIGKIEMEPVGYKTVTPIYLDLMNEQVDSYFAPVTSALPHIKTGKLRPLGVTGKGRSAKLPNVPTIAEAALPTYEATSWYFITAPAGTPHAVIETLNNATSRVLAMQDVRERLLALGSEAAPSSPAELAKRIVDATVQFGRFAKELGIKAQ